VDSGALSSASSPSGDSLDAAAPGAPVRVGVALTSGLSRGQLDDFCVALGAATGLEIEAVGVWYYHRLLEAMDVGHVDVAWLPPILAATAMIRGLGVPFALPVRGGVTSYSTALFARQDSSIRDVRDLSGARAAWVDRQSASGYLLIRAHLRGLGIDLERAIAADRFTGSHEEVAQAVLDGSADVGASYLHLDALAERPVRAAWGDAPVRVLAHAGPIPADVIARSRRLDDKAQRRIEQALVSAHSPRLREASRVLLGAEGFALPRPGHLDAVAALLPRLDEHAIPHSVGWPRR
jgi:phosphate/phosphite/phosphonate ABC transporter binding protein